MTYFQCGIQTFLYSHLYTQQSPIMCEFITTFLHSLSNKVFFFFSINFMGPLQYHLLGYVDLPAPRTFISTSWTLVCAHAMNPCSLL
jgi:hypothetical protein